LTAENPTENAPFGISNRNYLSLGTEPTVRLSSRNPSAVGVTPAGRAGSVASEPRHFALAVDSTRRHDASAWWVSDRACERRQDRGRPTARNEGGSRTLRCKQLRIV